MRRATILLLAGLGCALGSATAAPEDDARYLPLYDMLWNVVSRRYYDPQFRGADWRGARERYRARAEAVGTDEAFGLLAAEMLAEIGSSHLRVRGPGARTPRTSIGARITAMDGIQVVSDVAPLSDARRQGLQPGDRLVSALSTVRGAPGSVAGLEVERCSGERVRLEVRREQVYWPPPRPDMTWSELRSTAQARIGYLRVTRFDDGAAELADEAMAALMDVDALVIDLRSNTGGNMSALRLASYFGERAEPALVLLSRQYLQALGRPPGPADLAAVPRVSGAHTGGAVYRALAGRHGGAAFWTEDVPQRFAGPVYVLIGGNTRSAAEGFAWYMRRHTDAVLIGSATAGSLLSAQDLPLGEGWWVTVPVHGVWGPDGEDYADRRVPPHVPTRWTREDLCAGHDVDLATALSLASGG